MTDHGLCIACSERSIEYPGKALCRRCYAREYRNAKYAAKPKTAETDIAPLSYQGAHMRVRKWRGPARTRPCSWKCGRTAQEWAYKGGSAHEQRGTVHYVSDGYNYTSELAWSPYVYDYQAMCRACHKRFDGRA